MDIPKATKKFWSSTMINSNLRNMEVSRVRWARREGLFCFLAQKWKWHSNVVDQMINLGQQLWPISRFAIRCWRSKHQCFPFQSLSPRQWILLSNKGKDPSNRWDISTYPCVSNREGNSSCSNVKNCFLVQCRSCQARSIQNQTDLFEPSSNKRPRSLLYGDDDEDDSNSQMASNDQSSVTQEEANREVLMDDVIREH